MDCSLPYYGAFGEEILLRLFMMSWPGRFIDKPGDSRLTLAVLRTANMLAAILFGLCHLPATDRHRSWSCSCSTGYRLVGVAFGYLYFTRGLESAMLSHFSADLILHVLFAP